MGMVQGETLARAAVEMATAVAGGAEELRRRPVMSDLIGTVSPLMHDRDGIEAGLVFAEAGVPVCYVTMPNLGTTAPATKAGAFVVGAAEIVAAAVLHELAAPGAPVIGSIMQIYADPRTALTMTTPLDDRCRFLATELLHSFGIPALGPFGGTDAAGGRAPGSPASRPSCSCCRSRSTGASSTPGIGLTNTYQLFTPENLILDDDLYHRARHAFLDIPMDEESLALDVIDAVGPGGHFLAQPHTRRHMRDAVAALDEPGDRGRRTALPRPGGGGARARPRHPGELPAGAARRRRARRAARASSTRPTRRSRASAPRDGGRGSNGRGVARTPRPVASAAAPARRAARRRRRRRAPAAAAAAASTTTSLTAPSSHAVGAVHRAPDDGPVRRPRREPVRQAERRGSPAPRSRTTAVSVVCAATCTSPPPASGTVADDVAGGHHGLLLVQRRRPQVQRHVVERVLLPAGRVERRGDEGSQAGLPEPTRQ